MKIKEYLQKCNAYTHARYLSTMASILVLDAHQRLLTSPFVKHEIDENEKNVLECARVLLGGDILVSSMQMMQLCPFLEWFFEQDVSEGEAWIYGEYIGDKWNEFADMKKRERNKEG